MATAPIIRKACAGDAAELAALATQLGYPTDTAGMAERLPPLLSSSEHRVLVAADADDRAIAFLHAMVRRTVENEPVVEIAGLVVEEGHRDSAIGSTLVREAESWARTLGVRAIRVSTNIVRERTHGFYRKAGFQLSKTSHVYMKWLDRR